MPPVQLQHLPLCREDIYLKKLYMFLIRQDYIDQSTNAENFVFLMGGMERSPQVRPIVWNLTLQLLREMLEIVFAPVLDNNRMKKTEFEATVTFCFTKDGTPAVLPKSRHHDCQEYDKIIDFLATIAEG